MAILPENSSTFVQILCRRMRYRQLFSIVSAAIVLCSCNSDRYRSFTGYAQGGVYKVTVNMRGATASASSIAEKIEAILTEVDTTLSGYNKASQLSRYNAGELEQMSAMFQDILAVSESYRELTGGAFDVASAPLFDAWGFGFTRDSLPPADRIQAALEECRLGRKLNFNAIAQGYTCDLIADYLHSVGIKDMLVDIGEIYCEGHNPSGLGWSIGIDTPEDGNETPGASLSGIWRSDGGAYGVVTSGNYRKFYIKDGKKYPHTIDPRTGYPVEHDLLSATVVAPDATQADALATYFMVIGAEQAMAFVNATEGVEACLICSDSTWVSPGFNLAE